MNLFIPWALHGHLQADSFLNWTIHLFPYLNCYWFSVNEIQSIQIVAQRNLKKSQSNSYNTSGVLAGERLNRGIWSRLAGRC